MENLKLALKNHLEICRVIMEKHRSGISTPELMPGSLRFPAHRHSHFQNAITEAENSVEFAAFVQGLESGILSKDLDRLVSEEKKRRDKQQPSNVGIKAPHVDISQWRASLVRHAAHRFFINTGAHLSIWNGQVFDESKLIESLQSSRASTEYLRLFVFDGFVLYDDDKKLESIGLPDVGELKVYSEKDLDELLRLPQSALHDGNNAHLAEKINSWSVLTVREHEEYRGEVSWLLHFFNSMETKRENDVRFIAPVLLCLGEDANLAEEVQVRTNVFDSTPVVRNPRNGYLPWDSFDSEGNEQPRRIIKKIGKEGVALRKIFEVWGAVDRLSNQGFLLYPSQSYVRSLLGLHTSNNLMDIFVSLITTIESLLTPEGGSDLSYKIAMRASALLTHDAKKRLELFQQMKKWYKIRSKIVHEGHSMETDPYEIIRSKLLQISRQLFLRYITLLHLVDQKSLQNSLLPDANFLRNSDKRRKAVSDILDAAVVDSRLTVQIEEALNGWAINDRQ